VPGETECPCACAQLAPQHLAPTCRHA
jgi:hypothetical protein